MRCFLPILALALALSWGNAPAADLVSYRFERGVVTTGDSTGALIERAGRPDRTVQLENRYGAGVGERWEYFRREGKVVAFVIRDSRVVSIDEN